MTAVVLVFMVGAIAGMFCGLAIGEAHAEARRLDALERYRRQAPARRHHPSHRRN